MNFKIFHNEKKINFKIKDFKFIINKISFKKKV